MSDKLIYKVEHDGNVIRCFKLGGVDSLTEYGYSISLYKTGSTKKLYTLTTATPQGAIALADETMKLLKL